MSNNIITVGITASIALLISLALIVLSYLASSKKWEQNKLSPYECGFSPFNDAKDKFDIRYYLVTLLFILFDLEVTYLFPITCLDSINILNTGYIIYSIFLAILSIGFIYEYSSKALDLL